MNTNQSKRKAEFKKASHYPLVQMFGRAMRKSTGKGFSSRSVIINHIYCRTNYTDNTQFFGEDYQTDYPLTK